MRKYSRIFVFVLLVGGIVVLWACKGRSGRRLPACTPLTYGFASDSARLLFDTWLHDTLIIPNALRMMQGDTLANISGFCWGVTLSRSSHPHVCAALQTMLGMYPKAASHTRALMEAAYTCCPTVLEPQVAHILQYATQPKVFAMAAVYLHRLNPRRYPAEQLQAMATARFGTEHPMVVGLAYHLDGSTKVLPSITELFRYQRSHLQKVIYSFQRSNRDYPGLAIVQYPDGSFACDSTGCLKVFRQLARSSSALPSFLTHGNTPQGVIQIEGSVMSDNQFIGPSPCLVSYLPMERGHTTLEEYQAWWPTSWHAYPPIYEAYTAGRTGRGEIYLHGTTINPEYYRGQSYYPLTPSMGCLCALELWAADGSLQVSDHCRLLDAFWATPDSVALCYIIDIDAQNTAVTPAEVLNIVNQYSDIISCVD